MMESPEVGRQRRRLGPEMQRQSHEGVDPTDLGALAHSAVEAALRERGSVVVLVHHVDRQLHGVLHFPTLVHGVSPQLEHMCTDGRHPRIPQTTVNDQAFRLFQQPVSLSADVLGRILTDWNFFGKSIPDE